MMSCLMFLRRFAEIEKEKSLYKENGRGKVEGENQNHGSDSILNCFFENYLNATDNSIAFNLHNTIIG